MSTMPEVVNSYDTAQRVFKICKQNDYLYTHNRIDYTTYKGMRDICFRHAVLSEGNITGNERQRPSAITALVEDLL